MISESKMRKIQDYICENFLPTQTSQESKLIFQIARREVENQELKESNGELLAALESFMSLNEFKDIVFGDTASAIAAIQARQAIKKAKAVAGKHRKID